MKLAGVLKSVPFQSTLPTKSSSKKSHYVPGVWTGVWLIQLRPLAKYNLHSWYNNFFCDLTSNIDI